MGPLRPMAHEPSSPSKLMVPESRTRNLEAIAHVLIYPSFCYQTNLVPECMTELAKLLVRNSGTSNLDGELGSCAIGLSCTVLTAMRIAFCPGICIL